MRTLAVNRNDYFDGCRDGFWFISQFRPRFIWIFNENLKKIVVSTYARKNVSQRQKFPHVRIRQAMSCK